MWPMILLATEPACSTRPRMSDASEAVGVASQSRRTIDFSTALTKHTQALRTIGLLLRSFFPISLFESEQTRIFCWKLFSTSLKCAFYFSRDVSVAFLCSVGSSVLLK